MGIAIGSIVPKREITLEQLSGKIIAVDAYNTLYQFLANIRQPDGTPLMDSAGNITSHLSGLFYRTINLLIKNIKPVFVFDGKPPELKHAEHQQREEAKQKAMQKYVEAKETGDIEEAAKYARQTVKLTKQMVDESKQLLDAMGLPYVQAPSEGEAQAAFIVKRNDAYAVASQDYDALVFGAPRLVQNVTLARKRKLASGAFVPVQPELIELEQLLNSLQINHDQLICLAILVGTDFNPHGVKGIGPKKALQLIKQYKTPVQIFNAVKQKLDFDWQEVFSIFKKPNVTEKYNIKFGQPNTEKIKKLLVDKHEFSEDRIAHALEKLTKAREEAKQTSLQRWF